jgi:hypothetical protein
LDSEKCKIIHFGTSNKKYPFYLNKNLVVQEIERSTLEKYVDTYFSDDLKWSNQVKSAAFKANNMLTVLNNTFTCKD